MLDVVAQLGVHGPLFGRYKYDILVLSTCFERGAGGHDLEAVQFYHELCPTEG